LREKLSEEVNKLIENRWYMWAKKS
jgi:hypothetical protein